jgi:hypothetical protein
MQQKITKILNGQKPTTSMSVSVHASWSTASSLQLDTRNLYDQSSFVPLFAIVDATNSPTDVTLAADVGPALIVRAGTVAGYPLLAVPGGKLTFSTTGSVGYADITLLNMDLAPFADTGAVAQLVQDSTLLSVTTATPTAGQTGLATYSLPYVYGSDAGLSAGQPLRKMYASDLAKSLVLALSVTGPGTVTSGTVIAGSGTQRLVVSQLQVSVAGIAATGGGLTADIEVALVVGASIATGVPVASSIFHAAGAATNGTETILSLDLDGGFISNQGDSLFLVVTCIAGLANTGGYAVTNVGYCLLAS